MRAAFVALALFCAAPAAHAGLFDDEEARKQIAATSARLDQVQKDLEARLSTLEQQAKNQSLDLLRDLETIKTDLARIRGQIEVLTHELSEAQKRQRDLYVDLDSRLRRMEGGPSAAGAAPATDPAAPPAVASAPASALPAPAAGATPPLTVPAAPPAANEQRAYDAALEAFKRGDYGGAIGGFQSFVKTYPKSALAPSAQYWVGNAQFARREYRSAIASQRQLIQLWPDSAKVPDALLNIASAQSELGEGAAARRTLEELVGKYPQSESAAKAKQRLGAR
ncbi:MAG: tol-pal system protein YbgF [Betaproteobacteria bacterium]|nr:tol-pal system protein YbgF [Betaproteobacteria bacterium]